MKCKWHTCEKELSGRQKQFCSPNCKNKFYVTQNRKKNKERLVHEFGGKCVWCGYNKSNAALQFHHTEDDKEFGIASAGRTWSYIKLLTEAKKCILICANCHAEHHSLHR